MKLTYYMSAAGGLWQPDSQQLHAMREDIDAHPNRIKAVLRQPGIRKDYLEGVADDEKKALKKFLEKNKESALKVAPKVSESALSEDH
jgi:uncharacterized protein (DUF2461 family)